MRKLVVKTFVMLDGNMQASGGPEEDPLRNKIMATIKHAASTLDNQGFAAMDSAREHNFTFNEPFRLWLMRDPGRN